MNNNTAWRAQQIQMRTHSYPGAAAATSDASARRAAANKSSDVIPFVLRIAFFVCMISFRNVFARIFASFWFSFNNRKRSATGSADRASMETREKHKMRHPPPDINKRGISMHSLKLLRPLSILASGSHQHIRATQQVSLNSSTRHVPKRDWHCAVERHNQRVTWHATI